MCVHSFPLLCAVIVQTQDCAKFQTLHSTLLWRFIFWVFCMFWCCINAFSQFLHMFIQYTVIWVIQGNIGYKQVVSLLINLKYQLFLEVSNKLCRVKNLVSHLHVQSWRFYKYFPPTCIDKNSTHCSLLVHAKKIKSKN